MKMLTMWKVAILEEGFPTFPFLVSTTSSFSSLCFTWLAKNGLLLTIFKISGFQKTNFWNHLQNLWLSRNEILRTIFKILLWIITKLTLQPFSGSFQDLDPGDCTNIITMIDYHHYHHYHIAQKIWLIITSPLISSARLGLRSEPSTWKFKRLCDWNHYNFVILVKSITAIEFFTW